MLLNLPFLWPASAAFRRHQRSYPGFEPIVPYSNLTMALRMTNSATMLNYLRRAVAALR